MWIILHNKQEKATSSMEAQVWELEKKVKDNWEVSKQKLNVKEILKKKKRQGEGTEKKFGKN